MTKEEVLEVLRKYQEVPDDEEFSEYDDGIEWNEFWSNETKTVGDVNIQVVEDFGGADQGSQRYLVFSLEKNGETEYWQKDGYYASHYGTDWDGEFYQVKPVEKTITVYVGV